MNTTKISWEEAVRWCMSEPSMQKLAHDSYFDEPLLAAQRYQKSAEFAELKKLIPSSPGRALDLGAGNGILAYALATIGWTVTAVEPDSSELVGAGAIRQLAVDLDLSIEVVEAFGESIPIESTGYDLVVARQVLHHANDLPDFCLEMARLSAPGATIVTLRDHVISNLGQLPAFLELHPLHHLYGGENAFTLKQYRDSMNGAGLTVVKEYRSLMSVLNYDPLSKNDIKQKLSLMLGPLSSVARKCLDWLPFAFTAKVISVVDRRPGRLVSFVCVKRSS